MQPSKPIHAPLTIVGIVSNFVALTLVCVMLNTGPRFKLPSPKQVDELVRQIAKTKLVNLDDVIRQLGTPQTSRTKGINWVGKWAETDDSSDTEYVLYVFHVGQVSGDTYTIETEYTCTYRSGFKYVCWNAKRLFHSKTLLSFEPYSEHASEEIVLTIVK
jgi:hypothetical protein